MVTWCLSNKNNGFARNRIEPMNQLAFVAMWYYHSAIKG